jgi:hypothetical protein
MGHRFGFDDFASLEIALPRDIPKREKSKK